MSASAPAVNSVAFVGNLTADPVLKQLDDDRKVCQLRIAVNDQRDQPMFIDVATFGAQADACAKYLAKGRAVAVTGRLVYREWDDNGTRRSRHHIVGRVQFGGKPNGDEPAADTSDTAEEVATSDQHRRRRPTTAGATVSATPESIRPPTLQKGNDMTTLAFAEAPPRQFQVINLIGRLTPRDPETTTKNDKTVCRMRIAVQRCARQR